MFVGYVWMHVCIHGVTGLFDDNIIISKIVIIKDYCDTWRVYM